MRRVAVAGLVAAVAALAGCSAAGSASQAAGANAKPAVRPASYSSRATGSKLHLIKHVWTIMLENEDESATFGDAASDPYLAKTLREKGLLLKDYYGVGHNSNDNYVAIVSGQEPNVDNQEDCFTFRNFPNSSLVPGEPHQQAGDGCVYPKDILEIGNQLSAKKLSWKGYMEDMGNIPSREAAACGHPEVGSADNTEKAANGDGYATRHDPFPYFHAVIDNKKYCDAHIVAQGSPSGAMPKAALPGETGLAQDLRKASTTPAYSWITPNLCDDGHDYPCQDGQKSLGSAGADIDRWLEIWVPKILKSPAYKAGGLIEITFDEASTSDSSACCGESVDPNATGGMAGEKGYGGGKIGALLISSFIKPDTSSTKPYNHYSTLATDEAIFGLAKLGWAQKAHDFASTFFTH